MRTAELETKKRDRSMEGGGGKEREGRKVEGVFGGIEAGMKL